MEIRLLKWSDDLKQDLIYICNNVDRQYLSDRMPLPYTEADADWWLGMVCEHDGVDGLFRAIAVDGRIVGNISIECKSDVYRRDGEIGYLLLTDCWSQGIMTEAARLMCEEAFAKLDIARITGIVYAGNTASRRVLEKNGFVLEGFQRKAACKNGSMHDIFVFGKLREDRTPVSVDLMRRSDAYTIANYVPSKVLMYRAAYGVYLSYDGWRGDKAGGSECRKIAILVGGGNNGGDGYALAGILKEEGIDSTILKVSDKLSEDGRYYCEIAEARGVTIRDFGEAGEEVAGKAGGRDGDAAVPDADRTTQEDGTDLSDYDVIVDCILGTGFKGEVRGKAADAIRAINKASGNADGAAVPFVISVDINSGMNGDTGEASLAVVSDLTVSIGYYKQGLFKGDAPKYIKNMTNVDIGIILLEE